MTSKNNNNDDNPQNTKYCVLIDGDFGRHELFSNVHPYTLNRLGQLNNVFIFNTYTEEALKSVWLHSSINTSADNNHNEDITSKIEEVMSRHECDYMWIIHGIENHYEELIERLKYNKNSKTNISSYCWLENLKEGSNRIEYLVNNKIKYQTEDRIEQLSIQPILIESISIAKNTTEQKQSFKTKIKCDFHGCEKQFENLNALKDHQLSKHSSTQPEINEEIKTSASTTEKPKAVKKTKVVYDFDGCGKLLKNLNALKNHQLSKHSSIQPIINEETTAWASTTEKPKKAAQKTKVVCDFDGCRKLLKNLNALKDHQLSKHSSTEPEINKEIKTLASTIEEPKKATKKPKMECGFNDCKLLFNKRRLLKNHQIETHPIPLRCLFSEECLGSKERYLGILNLQNHIILQHKDSFQQQICPVNGCKSPKLWQDWSDALQHILKKHAQYLLGGITSHIQTRSTMDIPSWDLDGPFKCTYNDCDQFYWEEEALKRHEAFEHPVALLCPFCSHCQESRKKYFGLWSLRRHVISMHAPLFSQPTCFDSECKSEEEKLFKSWPAVLTHILVKHLGAVGIIGESTMSPPTTKRKIFKKCSYDTCNQSFKTRDMFLYHLITYHPYPLRCPYDSACNNIARGKVYLGSIELETHIKVDHSAQFSEPMCFDSKCQHKKHLQDWDAVVDHILRNHLLEIK